MKPKVSIIIPCFNEEKNICACLDSVFSLDYPKDRLEVIVVDNGSIDQTRKFALGYDVIFLENSTKKVSGLRNLGARSATGSILSFVDADCVVSENWLTAASEYFVDDKVVAWGAPPTVPKNATWVQKTWYTVRQKKKSVESVDWLESMNLFVRKNTFDEIGGFNETLETAEDVDFCYRVSRKGCIISDMNIRVVHTGEAASIKIFIKKEIWRGVSNLSGIKSHGLTLKEIPSLAVPLYYGVLIPLLFVIALVLRTPLVVGVVGCVYFLPVLAVLIKTTLKLGRMKKEIFYLFFIVQVYFWSRSISLFKFK